MEWVLLIMAIWKHTLKLRDVFHDETLTYEERRDEIIKRIKRSTFWDPESWTLADIVNELSECDSEWEFNDEWDRFYDHADEKRIWVETF